MSTRKRVQPIPLPREGVRKAQVLAERVVGAMMGQDKFSQWMGITVVDVRPRRATVRLTVRPEMVNGFGVAHGAIAYAAADSALAFASNTHGSVTMSIENTITYPAPVNVGDVLVAVAKKEAESGRLAYYRVVVRNQKDDIVALFRGTVYKTKTPHEAAKDA
ncbi:MAG TPA: hotdog fold thioesterase [Burkholderiales bacterium]|nr:hotdog fold thioesterase [Burkholderiales bacterium]